MFSKEQREGHDKRHKCSICGKVRYEKFMSHITRYGRIVVSRYRNQSWYCSERKICIEGAKNFNPY